MKQTILFLALTCILSAQEKSRSTVANYDSSFIVLNGGAGIGFYNFYGFVGATVPTKTLDYGFRYFTSRELVAEIAFGGNPGFNRPIQYISEYDFLIGKSFYFRGLSASFFTGVSAVGGVLRGKKLTSSMFGQSTYDEFEHLDKIKFGIPIEVRLAVRPSKYVDFGISKFININSKRTYQSFTFSVQLAAPL
jgi:hypothetical protein